MKVTQMRISASDRVENINEWEKKLVGKVEKAGRKGRKSW